MSGKRPLPCAAVFASVLLILFTDETAAFLDRGGTGELGAVDSLAGPGFCSKGTGIFDSGSATVRGLAVEDRPPGTFYVETGPPRQGYVARVGSTEDVATPAILLGTGVKLGKRVTEVSPGAMLARGGESGAFIAAGGKLLHLNGGLRPVAGDPRARDGAPGQNAGGDGESRFVARFKYILAVASDEAGNAYVADEVRPQDRTFRIRFVNLSPDPVTLYGGTPGERTIRPGAVDTIVGTPSGGGLERRGGVAALQGRGPSLAVDSGKLYVAVNDDSPSTSAGGRIAVVNLFGEPQTAHGVLAPPGRVVWVTGGTGETRGKQREQIASIAGITAGQSHLYVADREDHKVIRIGPSGRISRVAGASGNKAGGFNGNERPAETALLDSPSDVELGPQGRVYISDGLNGQVRLIDSAGIIRAAQGNGVGAVWTCRKVAVSGSQGKKIEGRLRGSPVAVAADASGNVIFAVDEINQIQRLGRDGVVSRVAGGMQTGVIDLQAGPSGIVLALEPGRLRAFNSGSRTRRVHGVAVRPGKDAVIAGAGVAEADSGGRSIALSGVGGLTADGNGNLFIADGPHGVHRIDLQGNLKTVVPPAGRGESCCSVSAKVAADRLGNLYVLEAPAGGFNTASGPRVWFVNLSRGSVVVQGRQVQSGGSLPLAGSGERPVDLEQQRRHRSGPATGVHLIFPAAIAVDNRGSLFIADRDSTSVSYETIVLRVDPRGQIERIAGAGGGRRFNGDGLPGPLTALRLSDIHADRCGNLLLADAGNLRIRRLNLEPNCSVFEVRASKSDAPDSDPAPGGLTSSTWLPWAVGTLGTLMAATGAVVFARSRSKRTDKTAQGNGDRP